MVRMICVPHLLIVGGGFLAATAFAQVPRIEPVSAAPQSVASPFGGGAIATEELGRIAGRADVAQSVNAENNATVSRNSVSGNSVTGTIAFDAQSFQNMNGLSVLSANTGNNVAINSSLNVNVMMHP